jgi:hypothetical protein
MPHCDKSLLVALDCLVLRLNRYENTRFRYVVRVSQFSCIDSSAVDTMPSEWSFQVQIPFPSRLFLSLFFFFTKKKKKNLKKKKKRLNVGLEPVPRDVYLVRVRCSMSFMSYSTTLRFLVPPRSTAYSTTPQKAYPT